MCLFVSPDDDGQEEEDREEVQHSSSHVYIGDSPAVTIIPRLMLQTVHDEEEGPSDSDSEGPILYKEEEDEDEDESHNSKAWENTSPVEMQDLSVLAKRVKDRGRTWPGSVQHPIFHNDPLMLLERPQRPVAS